MIVCNFCVWIICKFLRAKLLMILLLFFLIIHKERDILNRLNDVYIDGIGYSDVVGIIAFPLIIALLAFSFPFIFDRINQINDKYQSKLLSNLFSSSWLYRLFWKASFCCITYVIIYGGCSLFFREIPGTIYYILE